MKPKTFRINKLHFDRVDVAERLRIAGIDAVVRSSQSPNGVSMYGVVVILDGSSVGAAQAAVNAHNPPAVGPDQVPDPALKAAALLEMDKVDDI